MHEYLVRTRRPLYAFLFVVPLLLLYQVVGLVVNFGQRGSVINGADALVHDTLRLVGFPAWAAGWAVIAAAAGLFLYGRDAATRKEGIRWRYLGGVLLESSAYALVLGSLVAMLVRVLLPFGGVLQAGPSGVSWGQQLVAGIGAGLYEELVFRLVLTGGLWWIARRVGMKQTPAVAAAVLISAVLFSLYHYVGPFGEPFTLGSFLFRFVAGIVLAGLFAVRGFAVAAWTHSLYDVFLLVTGAAS